MQQSPDPVNDVFICHNFIKWNANTNFKFMSCLDMPERCSPSPFTRPINVLEQYCAQKRKTCFGWVLVSEWYFF